MPRINALPPQSAPDGADVFPSDDTSDNNTTKKISLTGLKTWLQSISSWIGNTNLLTTAGDIGGAWKSYNLNPQGFSSLTSSTGLYTQIGKTTHLYIYVSGPSNSVDFTFTVPASAANNFEKTVRVFNNGATSQGMVIISGTTATVYTTDVGAKFTASGAKTLYATVLTYEAA